MPQLAASGVFQNTEYEEVNPDKPLGNGTYGSVKLARHRTEGNKVAIKMLKRGNGIKAEHVERELCNLRILKHEHIIRYHQAFLTDTHLCIAMEYAPGGDMNTYIKAFHQLMGHGFTEEIARWFFWQLMVAVDYCHRQGVCNRDIKLQNTLVTHTAEETKNEDLLPLLKLCDFGFSKTEGMHSVPHSQLGTLHYMAPEVLSCANTRGYDGKAVDIWSCGVMLYRLLFNTYPFARSGRGENGFMEMSRRIRSGDYTIPAMIPVADGHELATSDSCKSLLQNMLCVDPTKRISMQGIFAHPWFREECDLRVLTMNDLIPASPYKDPEALQSMVQDVRHLVQQACHAPAAQ